jgi:hypothetical protein
VTPRTRVRLPCTAMPTSSVWRLTRPGGPTLEVTASYRGIISVVRLVDEDRLVVGCPLRTRDNMLVWCGRFGFEAVEVERAESKAWREGQR